MQNFIFKLITIFIYQHICIESRVSFKRGMVREISPFIFISTFKIIDFLNQRRKHKRKHEWREIIFSPFQYVEYHLPDIFFLCLEIQNHCKI